MTDYAQMSNSELAAAYNELAGQADAKFPTRGTTKPVEKFRTRTEGINRCVALAAMLFEDPNPPRLPGAGTSAATSVAGRSQDEPGPEAEAATAKGGASKGETTMAKTAKKAGKRPAKKATKKTAKKATNGASRPATKYAEMRISAFSDEASRRAGTKSAALFDKAKAYWKGHKNATVAEIMKATGYRGQDFKVDLAKKHFSVAKVSA